ncbi:cell division protein ZapE [Microbacterium sp. NPDC058345]|uniref:cell division protein ZapE n=1 Tax=Microbacterium sp. NPDC058345 TaxID=3346455 RepID=UPI00364AB8DB
MRWRHRRRTASEPHPLAIAAVAPFRAAVTRSELVLDDAQTAAVDALSRPLRRGCYLWGDVGRGKTLISDMYFASIPTAQKQRFHFHGFFHDLQSLIAHEREPLARSLQRLIGGSRAVLFDEFHVHDVADGVYLSAALRSLMDDGVLILATSNYRPEDLMPNPLFHERFLPAIHLLRTELDVVHLGDGRDYRIGRATSATGFAAGTWRVRAPVEASGPARTLDAAGQTLRARTLGDGMVFTFSDLCAQPLGVVQYLWLAERFHAVILTDVPDLAMVDRDPLARFAHLVDVLCDREVPLHVRAASEPDRLLEAYKPPRDARRIVSRLASLRRE